MKSAVTRRWVRRRRLTHPGLEGSRSPSQPPDSELQYEHPLGPHTSQHMWHPNGTLVALHIDAPFELGLAMTLAVFAAWDEHFAMEDEAA